MLKNSKKKKPISKRVENEEIEKVKEQMKKEPIVKKVFKKYKVPISAIDKVDMAFEDMDVSAKTKGGKIYFNIKFLDGGGFDEEHYAVHELIHYCQQVTDSLDDKEMEKDYLDNEHEMEAFENQVEYKEKEEGEGEAKRYVNQVLDHHNLKGKKRKRKFRELLSTAAKNILLKQSGQKWVFPPKQCVRSRCAHFPD